MEGVELTKVKYTHRGDTSRNSFETDLGINNKRQDYKICTVWEVLVGEERVNE
jgi:hypothetical protein